MTPREQALAPSDAAERIAALEADNATLLKRCHELEIENAVEIANREKLRAETAKLRTVMIAAAQMALDELAYVYREDEGSENLREVLLALKGVLEGTKP